MSSLMLWLRFAVRELRSGVSGFRIFLLCLFIGSAAIAVTGSLSNSLLRGLRDQGQVILGGDIEFSLLHRQMSGPEQKFADSLGQTSTIAVLRAMVTAGDSARLVEVKAVDAAWPLYGGTQFSGGKNIVDVMGAEGHIFHAAADPLLLGQLNLKPGDEIALGEVRLRVVAEILSEPDRLSQGFLLGPRLLISREALQASQLLRPGSLVTYQTRVRLGEGRALNERQFRTEAEKLFPEAGWRIKTRDRATQGLENFLSNLTAFLTLTGLAALIIGGVGIANAIAALVDRRAPSIATLKCIGISSRDIFGIFMTEILLMALLAVAAATFTGLISPWLVRYFAGPLLPVPLSSDLGMKPLLQAAAMSLLVTLAFSIWPVARTERISPALLFRAKITTVQGWPAIPYLITIAIVVSGLIGVALLSVENKRLTLFFLAGLVASFLLLAGLAQAIVWTASKMPRVGSVIWRQAFINLHRPGAATRSVILALGLGLTLLVTLSLSDHNLSRELRSGLPEQAPTFFFLDVPAADLAAFESLLRQQQGVTGLEAAPMLRGRVVRIGETPAEKVKANGDTAWVLRGDRGLTYAASLPQGSRLVKGDWWPADYSGPPLVSLVDEVAEGLGLHIGDHVTLNVLGREITATVANLRAVNWRSFGINFVMVFSPNTLQGAPHSNIVTVEAKGADEAAMLRATAKAYPMVSAISIRETLAMVSNLLGKVLMAIRGANSLTLLTGILVLAGALTAGLGQRCYEAVLLKTYGASRRQLLLGFLVEYALLGLCAVVFALVAGTGLAMLIVTQQLEMPFQMSLSTALATALLAMALTVATGFAVTYNALAAKPAAYLRNE